MIMIRNKIINIDHIKYIEYNEDIKRLDIIFTDSLKIYLYYFTVDEYNDLITDLEEGDLL